MKAVIDIGTNSIKFCVADDDGKIFLDEMEVTRLGEGINFESKMIRAENFEKSLSVIEAAWRLLVRESGSCEIIAVGTHALRTASNAHEFCERVRECCGVEVKIISGEEEARLSFVAASSLCGEKNCVVFDVGGGSTEIIWGQNGKIFEKTSLNVGALTRFKFESGIFRYSERAGSPRNADVSWTTVGGVPVAENGAFDFETRVVGVGGTVTTIAAVKNRLSEFDASKIHGTKITLSDVREQIKIYSSTTLEERKKIPGLSPDRADIIENGARIVENLLTQLDAKEFVVSCFGLRHGIITETGVFLV